MKHNSLRKSAAGILTGLMCAMSIPALPTAVFSTAYAASPGQTLSVGGGQNQHKEDNVDGYSYEIWLDNTGGSGSMTLGSGGSFNTEWSAQVSAGNFLARRGRNYDASKKATQYGNIVMDYAADYSASAQGNSRLCVYGWFKDPLVEYYIIEDWVNWCPSGSGSTVTVDGAQYDIFQLDHTGPTILGDTRTFKQYFSVRKQKRTSGTITVSDHFKAWENAGWNIGNLTEVALNVEGWESSGKANVSMLSIGEGSGGQQNQWQQEQPQQQNNDWNQQNQQQNDWNNQNQWNQNNDWNQQNQQQNNDWNNQNQWNQNNDWNQQNQQQNDWNNQNQNNDWNQQNQQQNDWNNQNQWNQNNDWNQQNQQQNNDWNNQNQWNQNNDWNQQNQQQNDWNNQNQWNQNNGDWWNNWNNFDWNNYDWNNNGWDNWNNWSDNNSWNSQVTIWGDANNNGRVDIADSVYIQQAISNPDQYQMNDQSRWNADVYQAGTGVTGQDANAIQSYLVGQNQNLPQSFQSYDQWNNWNNNDWNNQQNNWNQQNNDWNNQNNWNQQQNDWNAQNNWNNQNQQQNDWNAQNNWNNQNQQQNDWNNQNQWNQQQNDWNNQNQQNQQQNDWNNQNQWNQQQNDWNNQNQQNQQQNDWNNQNQQNQQQNDWNNQNQWNQQQNDWNNQNQWDQQQNDWNNQNQQNQQQNNNNSATPTMFDDFRNGSSKYFIASDGWTNGDPFDCGWYASQTSFRDGALNLTLDRDNTGKYSYAGAEYRTTDFYHYGYYETSMQPIKNVGVNSSFFTYTGESDGNPWDEIDIEFLCKDPTKVQFNYYTNGQGNHEKIYDLGFDASQSFHTYGFDWQPDHITWYVDGNPVYTAYDNIPKTAGKIMMNVWPGKGVDEWLGHYDGKTPLTARYQWVSYTKK